MRLSLAVALVALAALPALPAAAAEPRSPRPATLTVSGIGSVTRAPDRVTVSFRIESVDDQAGRASSANNTIDAALNGAMTRLGIAASSIKTTSYGISYNPRPPQPPPNTGVRYGYVVDRVVTVTADRTDNAGAIVDAGVGAGVTGVEGVAFELRDPRAAYRAALTVALADAQAQARTLGAAAHLRLVRIVDLAPGGTSPRPIPLMRATASTAFAPNVPTEIAPTDLTANATVSIRYEVAP